MSLVPRPVWIFLAGRCFSSKTVDSGGWICLDFLGFSRPNPDFSMGYSDKRRQKFFPAVWGPSKRQRAEDTMRKARIVHGSERNPVSGFLQEFVGACSDSC